MKRLLPLLGLFLSTLALPAYDPCAEKVALEAIPARTNRGRKHLDLPEPRLVVGVYQPAEVISILAFPGSAEELKGKDEAVFATWNIENLYIQGGKFLPDPQTGRRKQVKESRPKSARALDELTARIHRIDPDFMAVQEIENHRESDSLTDFVWERLAPAYRDADLKGNDFRGIRVGEFSRGFDVQYESNRDIPWVDPYDPPLYLNRTKLFSRDLPAAILRIPGFEEPYAVVLIVHGKSKRTEFGEDPISQGIRVEEQKGIAAVAKYYAARYPKSPIFIMGDMNSEFSGPAFDPLRRAGFEEVFDLVPGPKAPLEARQSQSFHPLNDDGWEMKAVHGALDCILTNAVGRKYLLSTRVVRPLDAQGREIPLAQSYAQREQRGGSDHDAREMVLDNQARLRDMGVISGKR